MPEAGERVLCAVSGGLDSMCLLHLLRAWCRERGGTVAAAHFNHRLRETTDRDERFVRETCEAWGVPLAVGRGEVRSLAEREGRSLEEAGRSLRYGFLRRTAEELGCTRIYTAHHANDNAETLLFHLIRGTGLKGLAGIPQRQGNVYRPLLETDRRELEEYAARWEIPHIEDESNADPDAASRNFLRLRVMPLLEELNPRAVEHMTRTAGILAREDEALETLAEMESSNAMKRPDGSWAMFTATLESWPRAATERAVLLLMARACGQRRDFTARHVQAVLELRPGGSLSLPHGLLVRREGDCLTFEKTAPLSPGRSAGLGETVSFGDWTVTLAEAPAKGGSYRLFLPPGAPLSVTHWRSGDRMRLPGQRGARTLKRLCAERGIPPWQRDALPVLRVGEAPAAVPGVGIDQEFALRRDEAAVYVTFARKKDKEDGRHEQ